MYIFFLLHLLFMYLLKQPNRRGTKKHSIWKVICSQVATIYGFKLQDIKIQDQHGHIRLGSYSEPY